jgi:hypothetical protein
LRFGDDVTSIEHRRQGFREESTDVRRPQDAHDDTNDDTDERHNECPSVAETDLLEDSETEKSEDEQAERPFEEHLRRIFRPNY